jgi:hypothetical protein
MYGGSATVRTIQTVFTADDRASAKLEAAERRGDELGDSMERTEQQLGAVTENQGESLAVHGGDESDSADTTHVWYAERIF